MRSGTADRTHQCVYFLVGVPLEEWYPNHLRAVLDSRVNGRKILYVGCCSARGPSGGRWHLWMHAFAKALPHFCLDYSAGRNTHLVLATSRTSVIETQFTGVGGQWKKEPHQPNKKVVAAATTMHVPFLTCPN